MSYYKNTTQTPNSLFDIHLKSLSMSELKVLLTIIRKTVGIVQADNPYKRIQRAWISQRLFATCTGLSTRAVSVAIDSLVVKGLIKVTDSNNNILTSKKARRGACLLYYSSNSLLEQPKNKNKASDFSCHHPVTKGHTIKPTVIKQSCDLNSQGSYKLSDRERILQILHSKKHLKE